MNTFVDPIVLSEEVRMASHGWQTTAWMLALCGMFGAALAITEGCSNLTKLNQCPEGTTSWACEAIIYWKSNCTCNPKHDVEPFCDTNLDGAEKQARVYFEQQKFRGSNVFSVNCTDTGSRYPQSIEPKRTAQTIPPPSCDTMASDDACRQCAKTYCCAEYQACLEDSNCTCLIDCLYNGNTVDLCTMPDSCGPPTDVSISTAACLSGYCQSSCTSACKCDGSTSGSGGGSP